MTMTQSWQNDDHTILLLTVMGKWSLEEYFEHYIKTIKMVEGESHPVVLLIDLLSSAAPPAKMLSTANFNRKHRTEHIVMTIMIGAHPFVKALADVMARSIMRQAAVAFVNTRSDALQLANKRLART